MDRYKTGFEESDMHEEMIRAVIYAGVTKKDIIKTYDEYGLTGVYNLGLKNMAEYLIKKENK